MKSWCITFTCVATLCSAAIANAAEVVISSAAEATIKLEASNPHKQFSLDKVQMAQTGALMRTWVSGSMDLSKAQKRESSRVIGRTSYVEQSTVDTLRLPTERFKITQKNAIPTSKVKAQSGVQLDPKAAKTLKLVTPVHMIYRESPGHLKFHKIKETKAKKPLTKTQAIQAAQNFLSDNLLLKQTDFDKVGDIYVQERRINEDRGEGQEPDDYLVQQDVVFERQVDGKPVVNSRIVVGFQPDTMDIVLLEHFNWTPLLELQAADQSDKPLSTTPFSRKQAISSTGQSQPSETSSAKTASHTDLKIQAVRAPSATNMRKQVEAKIRAVSGRSASNAEVVNVISAWFQTEENLVPVLAIEVNVTVASPMGPITEPYLELINLAGNDDIFFPGQSQPITPETAPNQ